MPVQDAAAGGLAYIGSILMQGDDHLLRIPGEDDFAIGLQQFVESRPDVGDERRAAGRRLEQPDGGGPASLDHVGARDDQRVARSEEHTSERQSLMRRTYAVIGLTKKKKNKS